MNAGAAAALRHDAVGWRAAQFDGGGRGRGRLLNVDRLQGWVAGARGGRRENLHLLGQKLLLDVLLCGCWSLLYFSISSGVKVMGWLSRGARDASSAPSADSILGSPLGGA